MRRFGVLLLCVSALGTCSTCLATTWHVPSQYPTIQAGIDSAGAGDTVLVACGTYYEHDIVMKSGICLRSETGEAECVTIDGEELSTIMYLDNADSATRIEGLTITNGRDVGGYEEGTVGGLSLTSSSPALANCNFIRNNGGLGGGLYLSESSPAVTGCVFSDNAAYEGGGVCAINSSPQLSHCSFLSNGQKHCVGGGMYCSGGSCIITDCVFSENHSGAWNWGYLGGALYCDSATVTLSGCLFKQHPLDVARFYDATVTVTHCTFDSNFAPVIAGERSMATVSSCIFSNNLGGDFYSILDCDSAAVSNCTFAGNVAQYLSVVSVTSGSVSNCTFSGNDGRYEGWMVSGRDLELKSSIIAFNAGGAVHRSDWSYEAGPVLTCCNVFGNVGGDWVGWIDDQYGSNGNLHEDPQFCNHKEGDFKLCASSPCLPENNSCGVLIGAYDIGDCLCPERACDCLEVPSGYETIGDAFAVASACDTVLVHPGTYTENVLLPWGVILVSAKGPDSTVIDGGGEGRVVMISATTWKDMDPAGEPAVLDGFTITAGGVSGIRVADCDPVIRNCIIAGNSGEEGAGLSFGSSSARVENCVISGNASTGDGGGVRCYSASTPTFRKCIFSQNSAGGDGGALHFLFADVRVDSCLFNDNESSDKGGAIHGAIGGLRLDNCTLAGNAAANEGGAVSLHSCRASRWRGIKGCTFFGNSAPQGGGIAVDACHPPPECLSIENTIIAFSPEGEAVFSECANCVSLTCSDLYGNAGGDWVGCIADQYGVDGNISADPLFCDPDNGDFHIDENSPCAPNAQTGCELIGALGVGCSLIPPEITLGIFQNPYLTQHLDIYVIGSRDMEGASAVVWVGTDTISVHRLDEVENVWMGEYELTSSADSITVHACAEDQAGNEACVSVDFGARYVVAKQGGVVRSPDGGMSLTVSPGGLVRDCYVVILPGSSGDAVLISDPSRVRTASPEISTASPEQPASGLSYRVSPEGVLVGRGGTVEIRYAAEDLLGELPHRLFIEREGVGALESYVDPARGTVSATVSELGTFRLVVGGPGSSQLVDPTFMRTEPSYPNPFSSTTTIQFGIRARQRVSVAVYDVTGRCVAHLMDHAMGPGTSAVEWDGRSDGGYPVAPGMYFCRVKTQYAVSSEKVLVIR